MCNGYHSFSMGGCWDPGVTGAIRVFILRTLFLGMNELDMLIINSLIATLLWAKKIHKSRTWFYEICLTFDCQVSTEGMIILPLYL